MLNKISLTLACTTLAFLLAADFASAATRKQRWQVKNHPDVYSTHPNLPADVPYTNRRNRDWLGGYLDNTNGDNANNNGANNDGSVTTTSSPPHRDGRDRRRWRHH